MFKDDSTDFGAAQLARAIGGLVENQALMSRHVEELYNLIRVQDAVMTSLEDKLRRLYELLTPRFNEYFRFESEARAVWELFNDLRGTPDAPFPGDAKKRRRSLPVIEA